jgi:hypothetical protein
MKNLLLITLLTFLSFSITSCKDGTPPEPTIQPSFIDKVVGDYAGQFIVYDADFEEISRAFQSFQVLRSGDILHINLDGDIIKTVNLESIRGGIIFDVYYFDKVFDDGETYQLRGAQFETNSESFYSGEYSTTGKQMYLRLSMYTENVLVGYITLIGTQ